MGVTGNSPKKQKAVSPNAKEGDNEDTGEELGNENEKVLPDTKAENGIREGPKPVGESRPKTKKNKGIKDVQKSPATKDVKKLPKAKTGALNEDELVATEEYLQKFFRESFGKSSSKVSDVVSAHAQLQRFKDGDTIVLKGEAGKGVHVILKGKVMVATSDLTITIDTLQAGDMFGEISSMYDIPSTVNVVAASEAVIVFVPKRQFIEILEEFDAIMDIIDWCVHRRYLPTSDFIDTDRAYRRIAFKTLRRLKFFMAWPDNALKKLILSFEHQLVLLYPVGSMIILEGDPLNNMVCVIKGSLEIGHGPREIAKIEVNGRDKPFVFGEIALSGDNEVASVSVKAKEVCQVILVPKGNVLEVAEEFPALQNDIQGKHREQLQFVKRLGHVYKQYQPDVQMEILLHIIQQTVYYADRSDAEIRTKIRQGVYAEFDAGATVFLDVEQDSIEAFIVIRGEVELSKDIETGNGETDPEKHVVPEKKVIALRDVKLSSVKTTCPSLILKLPKVVRRPIQEENNLELV